MVWVACFHIYGWFALVLIDCFFHGRYKTTAGIKQKEYYVDTCKNYALFCIELLLSCHLNVDFWSPKHSRSKY